MKVVLFCGGQGIGCGNTPRSSPSRWSDRLSADPVARHALLRPLRPPRVHPLPGLQADVIKEYFLHYNEALSNDFVLSDGGRQVELLGSDIEDWRITFVDTGLNATIGERLLAVRHYLEGEEMFLANYGGHPHRCPARPHRSRSSAAAMPSAAFSSCRPPSYPFHVVRAAATARSTAIATSGHADLWINGGYFVLRREIFDYLRPGDELVEAPFRGLIAAGRLRSTRYEGFWAADGHAARPGGPRGPRPLRDPALGGLGPARGDRVSRLSDVLGLPLDRPVRCLALGAHPDDIEIGAGGTLLRLAEERPDTALCMVVLSATDERADEARTSATTFGAWATAATITILAGRDGYLPYDRPAELKSALAAVVLHPPDLVLVHRRDDAHQDHRFASDLAWQLFRQSTILEYEVPKWDGDVGQANVYVPLPAEIVEAQDRPPDAGVPVPAGQGLVYRRTPFERAFDSVAWSAEQRVASQKRSSPESSWSEDARPRHRSSGLYRDRPGPDVPGGRTRSRRARHRSLRRLHVRGSGADRAGPDDRSRPSRCDGGGPDRDRRDRCIWRPCRTTLSATSMRTSPTRSTTSRRSGLRSRHAKRASAASCSRRPAAITGLPGVRSLTSPLR